MIYEPDNWVILKIDNQGETFYKVLAGWSGSYLYGSSWKLNSGIIRCEDNDQYYNFCGHSGSVYKCRKDGYLVRMNIAHILSQLQQKYPENIKLMDDCDWNTFEWKSNE